MRVALWSYTKFIMKLAKITKRAIMTTMKTHKKGYKALYLLIILSLLTPAFASASHSWGGYHWYRSINPLSLNLGDNVSSQWDAYLGEASSDWSVSEVIDTTVIKGGTTPRICSAKTGKVEICNASYGNNGWLGIATIWINGLHITKGTVKVNDTYFSKSYYNKPEWKRLVMCQEVGHIFGLSHQDENNYNTPLGSCMDYSSNPVPNQHPNAHDYEQLLSIYSHLDAVLGATSQQSLFGRYAAMNAGDLNVNDLQNEIKELRDQKISSMERKLGSGEKVVTFIYWADNSDN